MSRDKSLDTVRGIACVLLVLYHVVGGNRESGLRLDAESAYREVNEALAHVRMPLFTFLSGVVYALRPVAPGTGKLFAAGKLKRLLLPFIFVSVLFAVLQKITPGTNAKLDWAEIPRVLIWPYGHLWFIAALLLVFAVVGALDYCRALGKPLAMVALFAVACASFELRHGAVGIFAWNRALYLLPFFVAGVTFKRFGWRWSMLCALGALASPGWEITIGIAFGVALLSHPPFRYWHGLGLIHTRSIYSTSSAPQPRALRWNTRASRVLHCSWSREYLSA
jgi:fucose 4-O-acetylase-like acetyltransferase